MTSHFCNDRFFSEGEGSGGMLRKKMFELWMAFIIQQTIIGVIFHEEILN